jgi:hypothetical protein
MIEVVDDLDDPIPSADLLAQLELGLGAGFVRALRAPADQISELALDCVDRDPRASALDSRADYYALLLLAAGADVSAVERLIIAHEPTTGDWQDGSELALDVLIRMAVRGNRRAQDALIGYTADGLRWPHVLWQVLESDYERTSRIPTWLSTVEELGAVLCERFPSATRLLSAMEEMGGIWDDDTASPPWSLWAAKHRVIADALQQADRAKGDARRDAPTFTSLSAKLAPLSTEQLLALEHQEHLVTGLLQERTSDADIRLLIMAARDESLPMRGPAIQALAYQQRPEALEFAADLSDDTVPRRLRGYIRRALRLLPYEQTRSLVHDWFKSDQQSRRWAAADVLGDHAIAADVPMIREYLCRDLLDRDTGNQFIISSLMRALLRHPDQGRYGELTSIFYNAPWSWLRRDVAGAMVETDPAFAQTHAAECLWDCEPEVRTLGTTCVEICAPGIRARLQALAADWAEVADTQQSARSRLQVR